jgi:hypothetical protein
VIKVDINYPERNREVILYKLDDLEGKDNKLYYGYFGFLEFDDRFIADDPITEHVRVTIYSGTTLIVECPALPKSHQTNTDRDQFAVDDFISVNMLKQMDIKRNKFLEDVDLNKGKHQDRRYKRLHLQFPDGHQLSSKELEGDHEEYEAPFDVTFSRSFHFTLKAIKRGNLLMLQPKS